MTYSSDVARAYSRANGERFLNELFEMLRIPSSVSYTHLTLPTNREV